MSAIPPDESVKFDRATLHAMRAAGLTHTEDRDAAGVVRIIVSGLPDGRAVYALSGPRFDVDGGLAPYYEGKRIA